MIQMNIMAFIKKIPTQHYPILLVYLALFIYAFLRSYYLSFTHDESLSFSIFNDVATISTTTANNHILNTFFMWISSFFLGNSEWALRLPNVLAFGVYLSACYLLLIKDKSNWLLIIGSSLLLLNPFLIEFFALARGYGISLGCMMVSLYFLLNNCFHYTSFHEFIKAYKRTLLFAFFAVLANLSMINYFIAVILIYFIQYLVLYKAKYNQFKISKSVLLFTLIPLIIGLGMLIFLSFKNQLFIGEKTLHATLNSMIESFIYFSDYPTWIFKSLKYSILVLFPIGLISVLFKKDFFGAFFLIILIIIIIIIGLIIENLLFHANFPAGRTSLLFFPLFGLFFYYFILHLITFYAPFKKIILICSILISSLLIYHFSNNINFKTTKTWHYDSQTKDVILTIESYAKKNKNPSAISCLWIFEPTINYYISSRKLNIAKVSREGIDLSTDFIYTLEDNSNLAGYKPIKKYTEIGSCLFVKK